jgi:DNA polymerase III epsilon subunit family exonuclease
MRMRWLSPWWRRPVREGLALDALAVEGFVAIDLETTGLDRRRAAIVAVAAIPYAAGRAGPVYAALVNPGRPIPAASTAIHGITDAMVRDSPSIGEVLPALERVWGGRVLVGHNVGFDVAILDRELLSHGRARLDNPALDVGRLAAALHPEWQDVTLETLAARLGIVIIGRHSAEGDARAAGDLLPALLPELTARGFRTVPELIWFQDTAAWSRLVY